MPFKKDDPHTKDAASRGGRTRTPEQAKEAGRKGGRARAKRAEIRRAKEESKFELSKSSLAPFKQLTDVDRRQLAVQAGGITPFEFACSILRDPDAHIADKKWACELLFPYMHRKLPTATEVQMTKQTINVDIKAIKQMSNEDLEKLLNLVQTDNEENSEDKAILTYD